MKRYKLLLAILTISFYASAQTSSGLWPGKEKIIFDGEIKNRVSLYAEVLDVYQKDKVITEFFLTDVKADTVIEDRVHNEGEAFLLQPVKNGFIITALDEDYDNKGKFLSKFTQVQIITVNHKLSVTTKIIQSGPLVNYLKRFKKYQKMR